jgi:subtilase family serine protease
MVHDLVPQFANHWDHVIDYDGKNHSRTKRLFGRLALLGPWMVILLVIQAKSQAAPEANLQSPEGRIPIRFRMPVRSLITERIDPTRTTPTRGAVYPDVAASRDVGPVERSLAMDHLQLVLRRTKERQVAFDAFVDALHRPGTDVYHHWLKPDDIGTQFGPALADIEAVCRYLESEGFVVDRVGTSRMFIDFSGTAQQVQDSFHTEIHAVVTRDGRHRYSAVRAASLPEALTPLVAGFASMSNIEAPTAFSGGQSSQVSAQAQPAATGTCSSGAPCFFVGPQDFYTIYNEAPLLAGGQYDGTGATIALLEQSDINTNDVAKFRETFNVVPNVPMFTPMIGRTGLCADPQITADEHEAVLDAEWAGAVAPGATLLFVSCATGATAGFLLSAEEVIDDNAASIMSLSYINAEVSGTYPDNDLASALWEQAAAQGQTVVVCAGDTGSATNVPNMHQIIASNGIAVNAFASTAYNVAAGGTDFQDVYNEIQGDSAYGPARYWGTSNSEGDSSALSYVPETAWNDSCAGSLLAASKDMSVSQLCDSDSAASTYKNGGGSGGISVVHPRPSWQEGTVYGLPAPSGSNNYRLVPDVSFYASDGSAGSGHGLLYYQSDENSPVRIGGGTSFVAPQVAGIFALIEQKTGSRLGQPNYVLYSLAGGAFGTTTFTGAGCNGSGTTTNTGVTASTPDSSCIFYDVVSGNNSQECTAKTSGCYSDGGSAGVLSTSLASAVPAYSAGQGYDLATGIGSANISNLVSAWPSEPTFIEAVSAGVIMIVAGQAGTATITITPVNGFSSAVTFACGGLPAEASCSFSPSSVTPKGTSVTSQLSVSTTAERARLLRPSGSPKYPIYAILLPWLAIALRRVGRRGRTARSAGWLYFPMVLLAAWPAIGCEHRSSPGTLSGTYTVNITASSSGARTLNQSATLTITIAN